MQRISKTISEFVVPAVTPDDTAAKAIDIMRARRSDCTLVMERGRLVGIFTERDFLYRVAANKRDPSKTTMREVMTSDPETLRPRDSVAYAINQMAVRGFRNIPIVDDSGQPTSILDIRHIIEHISDVFGELDDQKHDPVADEWTDIGGG